MGIATIVPGYNIYCASKQLSEVNQELIAAKANDQKIETITQEAFQKLQARQKSATGDLYRAKSATLLTLLLGGIGAVALFGLHRAGWNFKSFVGLLKQKELKIPGAVAATLTTLLSIRGIQYRRYENAARKEAVELKKASVSTGEEVEEKDTGTTSNKETENTTNTTASSIPVLISSASDSE